MLIRRYFLATAASAAVTVLPAGAQTDYPNRAIRAFWSVIPPVAASTLSRGC
jgi:choline-glycine betaine transporter